MAKRLHRTSFRRKSAASRARIVPLVRGFATVALVAIVVRSSWSSFSGSTAEQWAWILTPANLAPSATLVACVIISVLLRGIRWAVLLSSAPIEGLRLVAGFAWCFSIMQSIPFRVGEPYRVMWIKARGGSATFAAAAAVLDRLIDAVAICFVLTNGLLFNPALTALVSWNTLVLALVAAMFALIGALFVAPLILAKLVQVLSQGRLSALLEKGRLAVNSLLANGRWVIVILLTALTWLVMAAGFIHYLSSTISLDWPTALAVLALVNLSGVLALTPANMGVFEAVAVSVMSLAGTPANAALVVAIGLHLAIIVGQSVTGLAGRIWLLIREGG